MTRSTTEDLGKLRQITMQLAGHLQKMMPPAKKKEAEAPRPPLPPEYDRLLGRGDGVVDGIHTLGQLVIRLIDKERESCDSSEAAPVSVPKVTYEELDQRILAELDIIADRRRAKSTGAPAE